MAKDDPRPVIKHTGQAQLEQKASKVLRAFFKECAQRMVPMVVKYPETITPPDTVEEEADRLLAGRKMLVAMVKEGMLERKDMEFEIALSACFVWFQRLGVERMAQLLEEW